MTQLSLGFDTDEIQDNLMLLKNKLDGVYIHEFAWPVLFTYKRLDELNESNRISLANDGFLLNINVKKRYFYFTETPTIERLNELLQQGHSCLTLTQLPIKNRPERRNETCYILDTVFDPASYANSKKRYQRLVYPFKYLSSNHYTIRQLDMNDFDEIKTLHDTWVDNKFKNDPTVFVNNFPRARYLRCAEVALKNRDDYRIYGAFDIQNRLISVRVVGVNQTNVFDLAFFSNVWDTPSQLTEYLNIYYLRLLFDQGYKFFNCGLSQGSLRDFKEHLPHTEKTYFQYKGEKKL